MKSGGNKAKDVERNEIYVVYTFSLFFYLSLLFFLFLYLYPSISLTTDYSFGWRAPRQFEQVEGGTPVINGI